MTLALRCVILRDLFFCTLCTCSRIVDGIIKELFESEAIFCSDFSSVRRMIFITRTDQAETAEVERRYRAMHVRIRSGSCICIRTFTRYNRRFTVLDGSERGCERTRRKVSLMGQDARGEASLDHREPNRMGGKNIYRIIIQTECEFSLSLSSFLSSSQSH